MKKILLCILIVLILADTSHSFYMYDVPKQSNLVKGFGYTMAAVSILGGVGLFAKSKDFGGAYAGLALSGLGFYCGIRVYEW